ncbi:MAG: hypothetical protein ABIP51_11670, partial [Bacteroidia bacterium]
NENFGSPYIDYEDSTEETELYIKSLQSKYKQVELEMEEFGYFNEELDDDVSEGFRVKVKNDYVIVKNLIL